MSDLEWYKDLMRMITNRENDKGYDTKLIANTVYWILEQMADCKTEQIKEMANDEEQRQYNANN